MKLKNLIKELKKLEANGHGDLPVIVSDWQNDSAVEAGKTQFALDSKGRESIIIEIVYGSME